MTIAAELAALATTETNYTPTVRLDHTGGHIDSDPRTADEQPQAFDELIAKHGLEGWRVDPDKPRRVSRWQGFNGDWLEADRFYVIPDPTGNGATRLAEYLEAIQSAPPVEVYDTGGRAVSNFQASDLQIGKIDGGGTDGILAAFRAALHRARNEHEWAAERFDIGAIHAPFPGDCIEGIVSQSGRNIWRTDLTVTEQRAVFERLLYETVDAFAGYALPLHISVVNGNHDQATRVQNTRPGDGWATSAADSLRNGLALNPDAYGHVTVHTPDPERGYMTIQILDTVYTIVHGHQWRRGKAMTWWAEQSFHGQNPGAAHLLIHGHEHVWSYEATADRLRICSPTFDGGSNWFREHHGAESRRGGLFYVTTGRHATGITLV
ncbi:hypothetical protein [Rhodococcus opacus]|uniref:hypothetical protein n=1 Tax=Rhodococcus opacus TaxID=37919 RepID=UPI001C44EC04|nr:hypothetical protein [Rhodococcus opacus]MBV6758384.1 hypothetical protein [Rhodococcus opacus]